MALRITTSIENDAVVLRLHGWLLSAEVETFEEMLSDPTVPARIDLQWLVGADAAGVLALQRASDRGIALTHASPYLELLFRGAGAAGSPRS